MTTVVCMGFLLKLYSEMQGCISLQRVGVTGSGGDRKISRWAGWFFSFPRHRHHHTNCTSNFLVLSCRVRATVFLFIILLLLSHLWEKLPNNGRRPEMRRRTNLMKFYYTFKVVISIVIKHFRRAHRPRRSIRFYSLEKYHNVHPSVSFVLIKFPRII